MLTKNGAVKNLEVCNYEIIRQPATEGRIVGRQPHTPRKPRGARCERFDDMPGSRDCAGRR